MKMLFPKHQRARCVAAAVALSLMGCGGADSTGRGGRAGNRPPGSPSGAAGSTGGASGGFGNSIAGQPASAGTGPIVAGETGPCVNLQCRQTVCPGGGSTTISGTVFDPAGINPLYNVAVYVPNEPLAALPAGATCDSCDSLYTGSPIAATLTDAAGKFTLEKVPDGADIPLVVQVGKWRRQFTIPAVAQCQDNPQPDGTLRLPRNQGEGDIPNIAISTGMADTLECLLRRVGVDASEFVPGPDPGGRIHVFQGSALTDQAVVMALSMLFGGIPLPGAPTTAPPAPSSPAALWNTTDSLKAYDIVLLSCEGAETQAMNQQALYEYANAGGRVFASHFHYSWFNTGPFGGENLATWSVGANDLGNITGSIVTTLSSGQPFPKGQALAEWLGNVGALQNGMLPIDQARHNADVAASNTPSQPWILADQSSQAPGATQYFSFNTPVSAGNAPDAMFCGRVVFSDLHVGAASGDNPTLPVPQGCTMNALSPQEAALEFMLFDLSSCLTPDERPPQPPAVE